MYGASGPGVLVRAWVHEMQHCYDLELLSADGVDMKSADECHAEYQEPSELLRLIGLDPHRELMAAVGRIGAVFVRA